MSINFLYFKGTTRALAQLLNLLISYNKNIQLTLEIETNNRISLSINLMILSDDGVKKQKLSCFLLNYFEH